MNKNTISSHIITPSYESISQRHLYQIAQLKLTTTYWEYFLLNNKSSLDVVTFICKKMLPDELPHSRLILDEYNNIAGYFSVFTAEEQKFRCQNKPKLRKDANIRQLQALIYQLELQDTDYYLHNFSVRFDLQGIIYPPYHRKIADILFEHLMLIAKDHQKHSIKFFVWASHQPAIKFYKRNGGKIIHILDMSHLVFADQLFLMEIQVI